ncbi:hypothetical protein E4K64_29745 [Bradyrhizobium frederickii]|uniref:Uncharacterized protein n=1 Tax=Bradyrhizobium frederickii TaxID=2560054 RepID=A0A4Y9NR18_9BRAD|nr:hypothetical protein [Bradyrhizobium frederickii]TFV70380.1 hypothetical protein E4K64_29745 [Bradyrhizobium frederickii]
MTVQLTAEALDLLLGGLIADTPDLKADPTPATHRWVAQVLALIEAGRLAALPAKCSPREIRTWRRP